nr:PREDICTED: zinc finger protein SNAI3-like [Linepithema humile]
MCVLKNNRHVSLQTLFLGDTSSTNSKTQSIIVRIVGRRGDSGEGAIPDGVATIASASIAAAAGAAQSEGERDHFRPEVPVPEVRKVLLAELLDVSAFQIRVRLVAALSVPVLRPRQQVVPLDLQSYQEDPSGAGSDAEQALLVRGRTRRRFTYFRPIVLEKYHGAVRSPRHTLRLHQTSLNRRGFACPRCARTFHTSGGMSRHYRLECVDMPRFKCPHCDMRSKYTQAIYRHIRAKHHDMELRFIKLY